MTVELGVLVDRYQEQIDETYGYIDDCLTVWDRRKAIGEQGFPVLETSSLERIYESALVSAVMSWQTFASEWVVLALSRDSSVLGGKVAEKGRMTLTRGGGVKLFVETKPLGASMSPAKVRDLLEQGSSFLTVNYERQWTAYAALMGHEYAARVGRLSKHDFTLVELVTLLRNMSVHRSASSIREVRRLVTDDRVVALDASLGAGESCFARSTGVRPAGLGHYLAAEKRNPYSTDEYKRQRTRLAVMLGRMKKMSEVLR